MILAAADAGIGLSEYCIRVLEEAVGYKKNDPVGAGERKVEPVSRRKDAMLTIRLSGEDKERIRAMAKEAGVSVSEYVEKTMRGKNVFILLDGKEILHQISKIGTNINQLTMLANMGKITSPELSDVNHTLNRILKQMIKMLRKE